MRVCKTWYVAFTSSMYKFILLTDKFYLKNNLFAQDVMFHFNLVATKVLEYSFRENDFWVSQVMRVQLQRDLFLSKSGIRYVDNFLITLQPNEMHHSPHILPPLSLPKKSALIMLTPIIFWIQLTQCLFCLIFSRTRPPQWFVVQMWWPSPARW